MYKSDEVDDYTFLNHPQQGSSGYLLGNNDQSSSSRAWQEKKQQLLEERKRIEERTLESSRQSLRALYEAESTGIDTARQLVHQREQLENTEKNLDSVNNMMRHSQKCLNSMKSIFGGLKSMFSKTNEPNLNPKQISPQEYHKPSNLIARLGTVEEEASNVRAKNHPALINKGLDGSGFRFDDVATSNRNGYQLKSALIDQELDCNVGELQLGLGRMKNLAMGLSDELDEQNEMLPRIQAKAERAEDTLQYQNRQINQQLRK